MEFIDNHASKPFFLWYTTTIPHADLRLPESETGRFDNTIFIFTSDNGPHREGGADPEFFNSNAGFRGIKRDLYEGGIRVPMIVKWPSRVEAGSRTGHISAFWDFLPTMADIIGVKNVPASDGISFLPTLTGEGSQQQHGYLYWEFHEAGGRQAVREGDWKGVVCNVSKGDRMQLYNLADDPGEKHDVADSHPEIVAEFVDIMKQARTESDVFNFVLPTYNGDIQ